MSETTPPVQRASSPTPDVTGSDDIAALAKGGRTNTLGFVIRALGGIPFLFLGYRLYGVEDMGRFASAFVIVEIVALICALGEKRGLAQRLTDGADEEGTSAVNLVFDGMLASMLVSAAICSVLLLFPEVMFPNGTNSDLDIWMIAAIPAFALTEILLAAQAYRYDIATTVRARAIVEPWTRSIAAVAFFYIAAISEAGLAMAFLASIYAALATALWSFLRTYGLPKGWRPRPRYLARMTSRSLPLVGADVIERGTRLLDVFLLGLFTSSAAVGIYFFAQQIASLPQKLKTSFEPILSPVITKNLKTGNYGAIAAQVRQVGFWIIALQGGIALALGIPGEAVMGLGGPAIVGGTGALALLLAAEVVASMAVVSESVLVYIARKRNLAISIGVIALQGALTIGLIKACEALGLDEGFKAAGAALALVLALATSSLVKAMVLKTLLKAPVSNWRWALVHAAAPAVVVGFAFTLLPEWIELVVGIPAILATYGFVVWKRGFDEDDKVLFRRNVTPKGDGETA
ncbi:MATE-related transmembrane export protein [Erythrobacter litoralis]|uniref:Polysaccharide biosynthesis protein n=1 Tax=Erythrobacter litoralis TaxID=39960 RepID=A0A074MIW8_9SPHN|nr:MATE-related transmembrane export protein [Erythrobacter litoralis]KEO92735.1 polysaccharide biosynthesis protein [Erythrobacter litoralis]